MTKKLRLQRSIGNKELDFLLKGLTIKGQYNPSKERNSTCNVDYPLVCFFQTEDREPFLWVDKQHQHHIIIEKEDRYCYKGQGTYHIPKSNLDNKIWNGRYGSTVVTLDEVYTHDYALPQVKQLIINTDCFDKDEIYFWIEPTLHKHGFKLEQEHNTIIATKKETLK